MSHESERRAGERRHHFASELILPKEKEHIVGEDIVTLEDIEVFSDRSQQVKIQLTSGNYPFFGRIPFAFLPALEETTRSRYGQAFVQFPDAAKRVYEHLVENGINSFDEIDPQFLQPKITVLNSALRANRIKAGSPVFRFFSPGDHLIGEPLMDCPILVNGKPPENGTWKKDAKGKPIALLLSLDHSTREYVPRFNSHIEDPSRRVIEIDPFHPHPRDHLKQLLEPVPITSEIIPYLVYSNEVVTWPKGVYGRVRAIAYAGNNGSETHKTISLHGDSRWFDPDREWRMIFELQGRTTSEESANFVVVDLFQAA